jgi:hypothetical protein
MAKRNWDCNPTFPLCYYQPETTNHLLADCNFTEALWQSIASLFDLPDYNRMKSKGDLVEWVRYLTSQGSKHWKRKCLGILSTFWWTVWKERNRCIFDNKELSIPQLSRLLRADLELFATAQGYSCVVKAFSCFRV